MAAISNPQLRAELDELNHLVGTPATILPEVSFIRIQSVDGDQYATLIHNSAQLNITSRFGDRKERAPEEDTLSVVPGFIGSYPNVFFLVQDSEAAAFVDAITALRSEDDYARLLDVYGIRRTHPEFWTVSDTFNSAYRQAYLLESGVLDYNRLENR